MPIDDLTAYDRHNYYILGNLFGAVYDRYSEVELAHSKFHEQVLGDFPRLTLYMDECIRFSYHFADKMASPESKARSSYQSDASLRARTCVVHNLYSRNSQYLHSAYMLVLQGHASSPSHMLRAVLESVLAQYWLSLCTDDEVLKYTKQALPEPKPRVPRFAEFREKLYKGKTCNARTAYDKLSGYAHPNHLTVDRWYNRCKMKGVIDLLHTLSLFNTLSYSQLYEKFDRTVLDMVVAETKPFVAELLFTPDYRTYTLFPDKPEFADKLVYPDPAQSSKNKSKYFIDHTHKC